MSATTITATKPAVAEKDADYYIPRGPVEAELIFYSPPADGAAPYFFVEPQPEGIPRSNFSEARHKVVISDIRGKESEHNLQESAFEALSASQVPTSATTYETFNDDEEVKHVYYPEVEKLLLDNVPGAHKVVLFDHTIRRSHPGARRGPVSRVHVDQTPESAKLRVYLHLPASEADVLAKGRYRIINVWRPLNSKPVVASPLAFAAANSVHDEEDLVSVEHRYPDRTGATAGVKYNPNHKWFYWSGMTNAERLLIKCSDTDDAVVGKRVPHTAFTDPRTPAGAEGRESIEVRALVFG